MDLKAIEVLLAIAQSGTVAAAARSLDISRSSVRRRLDALEADVGTPLMHRGDDGARLTPAGRLLADRGEAIVRSAREATHQARIAAEKPEGLVRFVCPLGAPNDIRARVLNTLGQMHPGLRFEIIDTEDPLSLVDDAFDLLVYFGQPLTDGALFRRSLVRVQLGLMASPAYLEKHGTPETVEALAQHRLLAWRPPREPFKGLPGADGQTHPFLPDLESANMELIRELAAQGGGIAWCGIAPLGRADQSRELVPVLAEQVHNQITGWLVCPLPSTMDPRVRVMLEGMLQVLQPIDLG